MVVSRCRKWVGLAVLLAELMLPALLLAGPKGLFYYVSVDDSWQSLVANATKISIIAPQVFVVDRHGKVRGSVEERVRLLAAQYRIRLMPLLMNENFSPEVVHAILRDKGLRRQTIVEAIALCRENHCWGLQLDFESVPLEDRQHYTEFVREAARAFHAHGLKLSVAVPSPVAEVGDSQSSQKQKSREFAVTPTPYDFRQIAKYVDFISLMTYDHHSSGSPPGPIAGYRWVEESLRFMLRFVSRKKLFLGLGFYARCWCDWQVSEMSYGEAARLALRSGAPLLWNPVHRSPWFAFDGSGRRHVVWLENRQSLWEKLNLVQQYRLAGISAWRLGQEDPSFWEELK